MTRREFGVPSMGMLLVIATIALLSGLSPTLAWGKFTLGRLSVLKVHYCCEDLLGN
jgi:hypothetical protein